MPVDDSYTTALLHMNGDQNSQTFVDEAGHTVVVAGDTYIDTAAPKFATGCARFQGNHSSKGDVLTLTDIASELRFGSGDFTLDFWIKTASTSTGSLISRYAQGGGEGTWHCFDIIAYGGSTIYADFYYVSGGVHNYSYRAVASVPTFANNAWHHIAIVRYGTGSSSWAVYYDGTKTGWTSCGSSSLDDASTAPFRIGARGYYGSGSPGLWIGYMDEVRISKGIARWTANFTPPAGPYAPTAYELSLTEGLTTNETYEFAGSTWNKSVNEDVRSHYSMGSLADDLPIPDTSVSTDDQIVPILESIKALSDDVTTDDDIAADKVLAATPSETVSIHDLFEVVTGVVGNFNDSVPYEGVPRWTCKGYGGATLIQETAKFTLSATGTVGSAGSLQEQMKTRITASGFAGIFGIARNETKFRISAGGYPTVTGSLSQSMTTAIAAEGTTDYDYGILQYSRDY